MDPESLEAEAVDGTVRIEQIDDRAVFLIPREACRGLVKADPVLFPVPSKPERPVF